MLRAPNTRMQRTRSSPSALRSPLMRCPLGGVKSWGRVALWCFLALTSYEVARASQPIGPDPLPNETVLLLLDMGAGQVRPETVDTVVQGLLARDFGRHFTTAAILGWAVRDRLLTERDVRAVLARYGCDQSAVRSSLACLFTLQRLDGGLRSDWSNPQNVPECRGSGSDLFEGHGFERLSRAFLWSVGDPALVDLAESVPTATLDAVEHPAGVVVINGPTDSNPALFCTIHAWRRLQPPNRYLAYLEELRCRAR